MADAVQTTPLHELTAHQAARLIRERQIASVELVEHLLRWADQIDPAVQAWESLDAERALAAARAADDCTDDDRPPLHGVPFGAKDIFDSAGLRTAAGFRPYDRRVPQVDAEPVARLKRAGAILLGKTVTTQFAHADPSRTRNPWAADRTPGGSSSGSAAGVAARLVPMALGSQTAGSVLRPAAYNGVIGFKPTYGRISKRGVLPLAWSLDHVGLLARSVDDCALFLTACAGYDPADPASVDQAMPVIDRTLPAAPPRIGLVREGLQVAAPDVAEHSRQVATTFASAGAEVTEVSLGEPLDLILAVHHTIMQSEAAATHWQLLEQFPGAHGPRLRAYTEVGRLIPATAYLHAQRLRRRISRSLQQALTGFDVLLLPTATHVAPGRETTGDPSLQSPFTLVGYPTMSLPSGSSSADGLPFAIQLVAPAWSEADLLRIARWCAAQLTEPASPPMCSTP